jgi:hypothetical protein
LLLDRVQASFDNKTTFIDKSQSEKSTENIEIMKVRQKRVNNIIFVANLIKHKLIAKSLVQLIINNLFKL